MSDLLSSPVDEKVEITSNFQELPLPTEDEIENMLTEIRQLEQEEIQSSNEDDDKKQDRNNDALKNVLSDIPSFPETNK
ncbi:MAG: hypothetical protein COA95_07000 [Methylophaga sp.]|nr:MAG: hypothetical protein COA95_07000 [Methylophaga sp.]